ncbi:alpha/beta fold hydrolase [Methylocapsa sp. S129]|uniref:alpha/beta fold hydrolase n=1 Tax=Methylocapsa sp. S129 TaxID=1641869 RepID=UPI00131CF0BF|nr:alpha/beta fold hydrolase [Methylocapsa sp. S129]
MTALWPVLSALAGIIGALLVFTHGQARRIEARFPPVGDLVDAGQGPLHIVERAAAGPERGIVLLAHGASGNHADMMEALGERLAALGFRVIAVDRPGHGWSSRFHGRALSSPARQAALIRAVLARRGVMQAIVVAHSWAGVLGLAMALEAPEFTRGLVLLAPVSHPWPGGVSWHYTLAAMPGLGWLFRRLIVMPAGLIAMKAGVASVFAPGQPPADYIETTKLPLVLRPAHFLANAEDVADLKPFVAALAPRYGLIRAPTAIVTGDSDGVVYTHIHSLGCARDIPGATLTMLEDVGHSPHYSAPDSVIAAILEVERRAHAGEAAMRTAESPV